MNLNVIRSSATVTISTEVYSKSQKNVKRAEEILPSAEDFMNDIMEIFRPVEEIQ